MILFFSLLTVCLVLFSERLCICVYARMCVCAHITYTNIHTYAYIYIYVYSSAALLALAARSDGVVYGLVLKTNPGMKHHLYISVHINAGPCFSRFHWNGLPFSFLL